MSSRMVRCRQGHVFDANLHASCPVCAETAIPPSADADELVSQSKISGSVGVSHDALPAPSIRTALIGAGAAAIALVIAIGAWSLHRSSPAPEPIVRDETKADQTKTGDNSATKDANGTAETKQDGVKAETGGTPAQVASKVAPDKAGKTQDQSSSTATASEPKPFKQSAAAQPEQSYGEIAKLLGVSDLVVDMTAFFALKTHAGKQPTPAIIAAYEGLSKRGIAPASTELGNDYLNGRGVVQNDGIAIDYFKIAVEQRHPIARFVLAKIYQEGRLVIADQDAATTQLALAVREGVPAAIEVARNVKIDPARFGMSSGQLFDMAAKGNAKVVAAAKGFIKEGLASGYAALASYAVEHSKDETLRKQAPELAANAAKAGLDAGFRTLALIYANDAVVPANLTESAMWTALSLEVCGTPEVCSLTEKTLSTLKAKLDPSVVNYLDHIGEHLLKTSGSSDPLLDYQR